MAFSPENSAIRVDRALEDKLRNASFEEIKVHLQQAAVDQNLVTRDIYSPDVLIPTALADAAPQRFARVVIIDNKKHVVEADSEVALERAVSDLYRAALQPPAPAQPTQPRDEATGQCRSPSTTPAISEEQQAALTLKFQLGQLSTAEYLQQSGAVEQYLAQQGIPVDELKASVEEKREAVLTNSWEEATRQFLVSPEAADWVGGAKNLAIAQQLLSENNLTDQPSVDTLIAVWRHMKENSLVEDNPELVTRQRIQEATTHSDIQRALGRDGSGILGR